MQAASGASHQEGAMVLGRLRRSGVALSRLLILDKAEVEERSKEGVRKDAVY